MGFWEPFFGSVASLFTGRLFLASMTNKLFIGAKPRKEFKTAKKFQNVRGALSRFNSLKLSSKSIGKETEMKTFSEDKPFDTKIESSQNKLISSIENS